MDLPFRHISWKCALVPRSCWDYLDLGQYRETAREKLAATKLNPALCSVCDDVYLSMLNRQLQNPARIKHETNLLLDFGFKDFDVLLHDLSKFNMLVNAWWVDKARTEQGVVPVEYDGRLVHLGLLLGSQPDLLVGQSTQQVLTKLITCAVLLQACEVDPILRFLVVFHLWLHV